MKIFIVLFKKFKITISIILMVCSLETLCTDLPNKKQESVTKKFFQQYCTFKNGCISLGSCLTIYCIYKFKLFNIIKAKYYYQRLKNKPAIILK